MTAGERARVAAALAALFAAPAASRAQVPAAAPRWETSIHVERRTFTVDSAPWSPWLETGASIERLSEGGSVAFEAMESRRFDAWDTAVGVDAWGQLWRRAYGNARVEVAPDPGARPELDVAAALFQGFQPGWEAGAAWRLQRFPQGAPHVNGLTLSVARYLDGAYLRAGVELSGRDGVEGARLTTLARWYFRPPQDLFEFGFSWGESAELVGAGPEIGFGRGGHGHARLELYPWSTIGFGFGADVRVFEDLPVRHGLSASLHARW